jgi:hypothetical protein
MKVSGNFLTSVAFLPEKKHLGRGYVRALSVMAMTEIASLSGNRTPSITILTELSLPQIYSEMTAK